MKDLQEIKPDATKSELYNTKYTTKDYNGQFTEIRDREPVELYANLMYLSNQLAHVVGGKENVIANNPIYSSQMAFIRKSLMNIKDWCIHKIISEKKSGANVELVVDKKNSRVKYGSIFAIALPNYFEPFIVHIPEDFLTEDELMQCCDDSNRVWKKRLKTTFPAYISDEKAKLLEQIYKEKYMRSGNRHGTIKDRLRLFLSTRDRIEKRRKINGATTTKSMKSKSKQIDVKRDNMTLLRELANTLKIQLPEYFSNGFLQRTSYSLRDVYGHVDRIAREMFKQAGIKEENLDSEMAKLFIYMKVTEPLSTFKKLTAEERKNMVTQDVIEYREGFAFIAENMPEFTSYSDLKSKTKKTISKDKIHNADVIQVENPELVQEVQKLRGEVSVLTKQIEEYKRKLANSRKMLNRSQKNNKKLSRDNENLRQENRRLKDKNSATEAKLQAISGIVKRGEDENEK